MTKRLDDADARFEALTTSARNLRKLRSQVEDAEKQHVNLVKEFLEAAHRDLSRWSFEIVEHERTLAEGPLSEAAIAILGGLGDLMARILPGEGAGCPDKIGCTNIGQLGYVCFYICKTVQLQH